MARLSNLLGSRELAFEDNLEKGRIWVYHDGNMYSAFCNGFCWRAPGSGFIQIDVWGAAGSGAEMCCCGAGTPGNAPAFLRKCVCVQSGNYVCGYIGRSCNNADDLCFRGCSESTCVCWFGCSHRDLYESGQLPDTDDGKSWSNPWGWGSANNDALSNSTIEGVGSDKANNVGGNQGFRGGLGYCCITGACCRAGRNGGDFTRGCLCAQGGRGGISYCIDDKSPYSCFKVGYFCGSAVGPSGINMCDISRSACGMICNWCQNGYNVACAFGGDINCCGLWSCVTFAGCLPNCTCFFQHHVATAAGIFAEDGGTFSYNPSNDEPINSWSGAAMLAHMNSLKTLSRWPSHQEHFTCWNGQRSCGCYNMQGCMNFMPTGVPGNAPQPCPDVRDHGGRGGLGAVRIKFIPISGVSSY